MKQEKVTSWTASFPLSHTEAAKDEAALADSAKKILRGAICLKSGTNDDASD